MRVPVSDRLEEAAAEWADARMKDPEEALEEKVEQALLEVEHLAAGATDVSFELDDGAIQYEPSDDLRELLEAGAERADTDPSVVLSLHLDLFARTFLPDDAKRPADAPPGENF